MKTLYACQENLTSPIVGFFGVCYKIPMFTPKRIAEIRNALGMTVAEFAKEFGVHRETVYSWERGDSHPRYPALIKLTQLAKRVSVPSG